MKRNKLILILAMVLLLAACKEENTNTEDKALAEKNLANVIETEMPIVKDQISLDFFVRKSPGTADDWNDVLIFNEYEKMTNIDINWEMIPADGMAEKRNIRLASGSLPDAFHSTKMPVADQQKYGEQGVFIRLNDLIDDYAPNFKKILEENPEIEKAITMPDGNIYSFPYLFSPDFKSVLLGSRPFIREDWLKKLGLDSPTTTEEFYQYLKAVKEKDPNGNGEADEIPFGGTSMGRLTGWLQGSFGLSNRGMKHSYVDMEPEEEKLRFYKISDDYKQMLQYINKLYSEKLIEQNIYTIENNQYLANAENNLYGSTDFYSPDMLFGEEAGNKYKGAEALEGPNGDRLYTGVTSPVVDPGAFVITKANKNPAATVRWVDHFYGKEGIQMFFMGFEGKTFEKKPDGELVYVDDIINNPDGLSFDQAVVQYLTFPGGFYPALVTEEFYNGSEGSDMSLEATNTLEPYTIEEVWPTFTYTADETKILSSMGSDIEKYVNEMTDKFITGHTSFAEWDKYVKTVKDIGLDEYMKIKKAAYDRYKEN